MSTADWHEKNLAATIAENHPDFERLTAVLRSTITAHELCLKEFPPMRWVIPELLPEGLAIIAGKPKTGKSWLALNIASAVAVGGNVLGKIPVERGTVLYCALEDSERRLRSRFDLIGAIPTDKLHFATAWQRGAKGLEDLRLWLLSNPETRLVIIDTLARIREPSGEGYDYQEDYIFIEGIKRIADGRNLSIVLLHHTRKQGADDVFDLVSGTTGITGAADSLWVLQRTRGEADATLSVSGRDFREQELALKYEQEIGWTLLGDAREYAKSTERSAIVDLLKSSAEPMSPKEIAEALEKNPGAVRFLLMKMSQEGAIKKVARGAYTANGANLLTN